MAWAISITNQGWSDIQAALEKWSKEDLINAILDDNASKRENFRHHHRYNPQFKRVPRLKRENLERLYQDTLAEIALELVRENNTCDNGGFNYWVDIDGFHKVEFEKTIQPVTE